MADDQDDVDTITGAPAYKGREYWREGIEKQLPSAEDIVSETPKTVEGRAALRRHKGRGYTSAVGEYTPAEFWEALDHIDELERELSAAKEDAEAYRKLVAANFSVSAK